MRQEDREDEIKIISSGELKVLLNCTLCTLSRVVLNKSEHDSSILLLKTHISDGPERVKTFAQIILSCLNH